MSSSNQENSNGESVAGADEISALKPAADSDGLKVADLFGAVPASTIPGAPVKRKPGRPVGSGKKKQSVDTPIDKPKKTKLEAKAQTISSEVMAKMLLSMAVGMGVSFIGPEWDFDSQEEADGMVAAVGAYIDAKGDGTLSPGHMLALTVGMYAAKRIRHENTRGKLYRFAHFAGGALYRAKNYVMSKIKRV